MTLEILTNFHIFSSECCWK